MNTERDGEKVTLGSGLAALLVGKESETGNCRTSRRITKMTNKMSFRQMRITDYALRG